MTAGIPPFSALLHAARSAGGAVGAFNVVLLEHAEAIVEGAERAGTPVILQISENCVRYHGSLAPIALASLAIARSADVPALVHLDHIESVDLVREGLELGVDSIMFDGSALPYDDNLARTAEMSRLCREAGVAIEAELGRVGGKGGVHETGVRTDPREAADFVATTGVDALAVAVGTSHAMQTRTASVDMELVGRLSEAVAVPLVLHGSSGLADEELVGAVVAGMAKINVSTHLNGIFTRSVRATLASRAEAVDPRLYVAPGREAVAVEVQRLLTLLRSAPVPG